MEPPPPAAKFRAPAPKKVKENEDGGGEGVAAQPLADSTPNSQGEGKKSEPTAAAEGASSLPPPPPKKSGKHGAGAAKGGSYKPPSWGLADPPEASGLSLTVLKGGIEVSSISLDNRTHILLGRQQGVVDVLLEHPSISRKHAILQHGQNGALFLFDNGSTHGCIVNKNKIPSKEFHRLHVGDVIKFGESTRLYALEGPEELRPAEYESENLRNLRLDAGRKQLAAKLAKLKAGAAGEGKGAGDSGEYGISWGFDEDAVAEEEDEDGDGMEGDEGEVELPDYLKTEAQKRRRRDTKVGLTEDSVHKRDAKLFEKLQQKLTKVEHLLTENERITAKEGGQGGLTEGQQAQLARNDKAITGIRLQIEEIEETIRSKNKARERGKELEEGGAGGEKGGGGKGAAEDSEENDDYYDRTAPVLSASRASGSDPASKKAEIRARRFGARDKTKKLSAAVPGVGVGGGSGDGELGADGGAGAGGGAPVAQTLEALTRRREVVAEDLERTQAGLAELEAEEAEEAGEAALAAAGGGGDEEVAADPLDKFMSENRQKERRQALSRLTAQREALREEEARLKVMIEAARPSMPSLKTAAPASAAASAAAAEEDKKEAPPAKDNPDTAAKADRPEAVTGEKKPPPPALPDQSPTPIAAPARPRRPTDAGPRIGEAEVQGQGLGRGVEGAGSEVGAAAEPEPEPARRETKPASGPRKRGTPVGASMLPPPPAKRPQRKEKTSTPATERVGGGDGSPPPNEAKPKRTVKGPSAMPPPPGKPSAGTAGVGTPAAKAGNGGRGATGAGGKTLGKEVLEGGDVDWVPPKDALEKMAALNKKFGY